MRKSMPGEAVTGEMLPPNAQRKWPRASALACERRRATPPCQSRPKTWRPSVHFSDSLGRGLGDLAAEVREQALAFRPRSISRSRVRVPGSSDHFQPTAPPTGQLPRPLQAKVRIVVAGDQHGAKRKPHERQRSEGTNLP
jgi:hypothetical protein